MRWRALLIGVAVVAASVVCVRLGLWQWSRYEHKHALNRAERAVLALPPSRLEHPRTLPDTLLGRRVALRGTFDERHQVLLAGMIHTGEPGVHVITPLVLDGDSIAVLVDRGWLPAADAVHARPQDFPEPGAREVMGFADTLGSASKDSAVVLETDSVRVFSVAQLDYAPLAAALAIPLARYYVRELPSASAPSLPRREEPEPHEENMHLSYAVQWFAFAIVFLVGPAALAWSRRRKSLAGAQPKA